MPSFTVPDHRIEHDDHFSNACREQHLLVFTACNKALLKGFDRRIMLYRGEYGHYGMRSKKRPPERRGYIVRLRRDDLGVISNEMDKITDIYNFRSVEDALSTSGQPTEAQLRALAAAGYEVIINLALHDDTRYSLADEKGLVEELQMTYIHIPVQFDEPTEDDLEAFFNAMDGNKKSRVHIHCAANMRVTAFLGLYRMFKQGKSEGEAFELMKSVWTPNDVWLSFISNTSTKYTA